MLLQNQNFRNAFWPSTLDGFFEFFNKGLNKHPDYKFHNRRLEKHRSELKTEKKMGLFSNASDEHCLQHWLPPRYNLGHHLRSIPTPVNSASTTPRSRARLGDIVTTSCRTTSPPISSHRTRRCSTGSEIHSSRTATCSSCRWATHPWCCSSP